MKQLLISLSLVCLSVLVFAQSNIDVLHYRYEIELNDNNDTVFGKAQITFIGNYYFNSPIELTKFNSSGKGMRLDSVYFLKKNSKDIFFPAKNNSFTAEIKYETDKLNMDYTGEKPKSKFIDTFNIIICYHGIPTDGLIISKNKYGHRTFFSDNWPNRAHNWIPCIDDPADKASVEFIITAPAHYQVVSNGALVEETNLPDNKKLTHWKEDLPLPTKVMVIGVADFAVNYLGDINCVPVSSWVFPENKKMVLMIMPRRRIYFLFL